MKNKDWFDFIAIFIMISVAYGLRDYFASIGMVLVAGISIIFKYNDITKRKFVSEGGEE